MLLNFARSVVFTGAPSFPMVASIRAAYQVIAKGEICAVRGLLIIESHLSSPNAHCLAPPYRSRSRSSAM